MHGEAPGLDDRPDPAALAAAQPPVVGVLTKGDATRSQYFNGIAGCILDRHSLNHEVVARRLDYFCWLSWLCSRGICI